jgi:DtxR family transcriptional regulator, Mn-dependent transcriptional regulator
MPKSTWLRLLRKLTALTGRQRRTADRRARERDEDALKHLHECERAGRACTVAELAGRIGIGEGDAAALARRLSEHGLARMAATGLELTPTGRSYARQVLRTHRLWERYLADRTGVPAGEWHAAAEQVEHELTPDEAEALAASLGDPRYDPHGDPIPTASGDIPAPRGVPLNRVPAGRSVIVTHLEDEPREVFDRLLAAGLTPGLAMEVVAGAEAAGATRLEATGTAALAPVAQPADAVVVLVRGEERQLAAVDAANVTVEALPVGQRAPGRRRTLADARQGEEVRVVGISPACQGPQRRRLLDLGVVPGTQIEPELVSASGDPVAYRIRGP